jgi:dihydroorotate dehydrogenase (NAD+) catalytic subunit
MKLLRRGSRSPIDLSTKVFGVEVVSPILSASGTSGYGAELAAFFDLSSIGAIVVKSLAHFAHGGNKAPRVGALSTGMINSVGLPGPGVRAWIQRYLPYLIEHRAKVVVSIWGRTQSDYAQAAQELEEVSEALTALEINVSCPNTERAGEMFGHDPRETKQIVDAVSAVTSLPIALKLSPNTDRYLEVACAAIEGGANTIVAANTYLGYAHEKGGTRSILGSDGGGVSGAGIRPVSLRIVRELRHALPDCDIVGVGGIYSAKDAVSYLLEGASAVEVGTASFFDPRSISKIQEDLKTMITRSGVGTLAEYLERLRAS